MLSFGDFKKIDLRVAKIVRAERIEGSDKLLRLIIILGEELGERQIIAGIAGAYSPEELKGREIVVVANLEEKEIFGETSQGMLLAASSQGKPVLLRPDQEVDPGAEIH
ncbi:MAG: methionine--tRNA ligase subunit beta [Candidatus Nealsonbacteria bacterium]|nr:methionine--tRNA ligase subunit beta [Candidatus Nealsonbacteria bacterium]